MIGPDQDNVLIVDKIEALWNAASAHCQIICGEPLDGSDNWEPVYPGPDAAVDEITRYLEGTV